MGSLADLPNPLADSRFAANLIAAYGAIVVVVLACLVLRRWLTRVGHQLAARTGLGWLDPVGKEAARHGRTLLAWITVAVILAVALVGAAYHFTGRDIRDDVGSHTDRLTASDWLSFTLRLGALAALPVLAWFAVRVARRIRGPVEAWIGLHFSHPDNADALRRLFPRLERCAAITLGFGCAGAAVLLLGLGDWAESAVRLGWHLFLLLAAARLLPLACRALSRHAADLGTRYLGRGRPRRYWERVVRLVPFGERCFESAVYILCASHAVGELHFIAVIADFGPRLVECIAIFFGTRVLIELSHVLLHEAFGLFDEAPKEAGPPELAPDFATELSQKGRTLVPLLYSVCQYVLYFGSAVVMLGVLGVDTRPILAGAGILGLAVGLGAQSLVTDVVSGFFILFENQYLVGDYVKIGDAAGVVEAVGIRVTQVRDGHGKLHLIPNGQIKGVINYSKGFVNAVVDVKLPAGGDLEGLFRAMAEAGRRLRQTRREVLADTEVHGLVELGASDMTVRAVTKVQPGTHETMANEYRRLLKQAMDQAARSTRAAA